MENLINFDKKNTVTVKESGLVATFATTDNGPKDYKSGNWFSENTNFALKGKEVIYLDYRHGRDELFKSATVAKITNLRKNGANHQGDLEILDEFKGTQIEQDVKDGKLFVSSLTHPIMYDYDKDTGEILEWPILNGALTPKPDLLTKDTKITNVMTVKEFTDAFNNEGTTDAGTPAESNKGDTMKSVAEMLGYSKEKPDEEAVSELTTAIQTLKESQETLKAENDALKDENETLKASQTAKEKSGADGLATLTDTVKELADKFETVEAGNVALKEANDGLLTTVKELTGFLESGRGERGDNAGTKTKTYVYAGKTYTEPEEAK